jgi:hypothetical protein
MRTTLNLPDAIATQAKKRALEEDTTMTDILVQGHNARLERTTLARALPVSKVTGGLASGVAWDRLVAAESEGERYR